MEGVVFDIVEMTVNDGPGVRTTVFLKGCPLRCQWCHNPEGLSFRPQRMVSSAGCTNCGACREVCPSPDACTACGECVKVCPARLRRIAGTVFQPEELAARLKKHQDFLTRMGGGVTFSGGEPTAQPEFLISVLKLLDGMHRTIETSGYCDAETFQQILKYVDYVIMDIKLVDSRKHRQFTGVDNKKILNNLEYLKRSGLPFLIRVPLIPGVNDSRENLEQTARLLENCPTLEGVELLPYHQTAGAKYEMVGIPYAPGFDVTKEPVGDMQVFQCRGIPCRSL